MSMLNLTWRYGNSVVDDGQSRLGVRCSVPAAAGLGMRFHNLTGLLLMMEEEKAGHAVASTLIDKPKWSVHFFCRGVHCTLCS